MMSDERPNSNGISLWVYGVVALVLVGLGLVFRPVIEARMGIGGAGWTSNSENTAVLEFSVPIEAGIVLDGVFHGGDERVEVVECSMIQPAYRLTSIVPIDIGSIEFRLDGVPVPSGQPFPAPPARRKSYKLELEGFGNNGKSHFQRSCFIRVISPTKAEED